MNLGTVNTVIVPFWYSSAPCQVRLVSSWIIWLDQTYLICRRRVPKIKGTIRYKKNTCKKVFEFSKDDTFWKQNTLSGRDLRPMCSWDRVSEPVGQLRTMLPLKAFQENTYCAFRVLCIGLKKIIFRSFRKRNRSQKKANTSIRTLE